MFWAQVIAGSAVLQDEACTRRDDAAAEGVGHAVDEGTGIALLVSDAEIHCVAGLVDSQRVPWCGDVRRLRWVEERGALGEIWLR